MTGARASGKAGSGAGDTPLACWETRSFSGTPKEAESLALLQGLRVPAWLASFAGGLPSPGTRPGPHRALELGARCARLQRGRGSGL